MTSYDRFTFGIPRLYLGLDLAVCLIGLFAWWRSWPRRKRSWVSCAWIPPRCTTTQDHPSGIQADDPPVLMSSLIGVMVGIVPGTGASEASWFSYNTAKNLSKHPEEFGRALWRALLPPSRPTTPSPAPPSSPAHPGHSRRRHRGIMLSALMING